MLQKSIFGECCYEVKCVFSDLTTHDHQTASFWSTLSHVVFAKMVPDSWRPCLANVHWWVFDTICCLCSRPWTI